MSARSEELEGLREGEPVDGAAAGPDETVLLDAVHAGDEPVEAPSGGAAGAGEADGADVKAGGKKANGKTAGDKTAGDKTAGGKTTDAGARAHGEDAAGADDPADQDRRDAEPGGAVSPAMFDDSEDREVRRRSQPADPADAEAAADAVADRTPDAEDDGEIRRRSTPRDGIPRKREHGLPKYEELAAEGSEDREGSGDRDRDRDRDRSAGRDRDREQPAVRATAAAASASASAATAPDRAAARAASAAAAVVADGVAQDVADETARAVAEAAGDDDPAAGSTAGPTSSDAEADLSAVAPPRKPDRHTFLYGKGRRVLPWRHKSRLAGPQRRRRKITVRTIWACVLVAFATLSWSIIGALTAPGTDTIQVRLAEWGRDHGLGGVVSTLEKWQYDLNPPKKGGTVDQSQFADLGPTAEPARPSATKPGKPGSQQPAPGTIAMRPPLAASAGLTLEPGEGVFHPAVSTADGQPVIQLARIRPDSVYTSVTADVLWIDQKHTKYVLHPGHEGGVNKQVPVPNQIEKDTRPNLIALFNGGFKISESHGGYFDHGVTVAPLEDGAASEVIFADGHMSVGMWGRDFSFAKNPDIVSVRQNLKLMVDDNKVVPYIDDASNWGRSDHGSAAVWRSGVGVTAAGDIVYVAGNDLTAPSLADLLQRAGALHAMQLDINLRWADFQYFPNRDGNPDNSKLYGDFLQGATKFFADSTKDFMAVYVR